MTDSLRRKFVRASILEAKIVNSNYEWLDRLAEEVEYAMFPTTHEKKQPTYGCIITSHQGGMSSSELRAESIPIEIAREMSDGVDSYLVFQRGNPACIVDPFMPMRNEFELVNSPFSGWGPIVQSGSFGEVRVFHNGRLWINEQGVWEGRPLPKSVLSSVSRVATQVNREVLLNILNLAFHILGASKVGATLVWWLTAIPNDMRGGIDMTSTLLNCSNDKYASIIRSLLRQHDGATMITPAGEIHSIGHHLKASENSIRFIDQCAGTRHTSARRFSFDEPRAIVVTVSEDGPVSVFSDGVKVTELRQTPLGATLRSLGNLVPAKRPEMGSDVQEIQCSNCHKWFVVEFVTIGGWKERETEECLICGEQLVARMCHSITAHLVKKLPND